MPRANGSVESDLRNGHYSVDGRWWWDNPRGRWFRTTEPIETVRVELEDDGHSSFGRSVMTTLTGQFGTQSYRFVARQRGEHDHGPYLISETFAMLPLALGPGEPVPEIGGWPEEVRRAHHGLTDELKRRGWRYRGTGRSWWSTRHDRPSIDWDTPEDAYDLEH